MYFFNIIILLAAATIFTGFVAGSAIPEGLSSLQARVDTSGALGCCPIGNWGWQECSFNDYFLATEDLYNVGGTVVVQPNSCDLVSGVNGCGIWLCDNSPPGGEAYNVRRTTIAQFATSVQDRCNHGKSGPACGQLFAVGQSWNVIVHTY